MRQIGWIERQVRRADRFQQRHTVLAFPWAVVQKFGNDQAGGKAALMAYYGLFALFPLLLLLATILGFALFFLEGASGGVVTGRFVNANVDMNAFSNSYDSNSLTHFVKLIQ